MEIEVEGLYSYLATIMKLTSSLCGMWIPAINVQKTLWLFVKEQNNYMARKKIVTSPKH